MSNLIELKVPDIGGHSNVDVIEVFVKVGDTVAKDDSLITLETDKATMDVPSDVAGKIVEVKIKVGDKVSQGTVIATAEAGAAAAPAWLASGEAAAAAIALHGIRGIGHQLQLMQNELRDNDGAIQEAGFDDIGDASVNDHAGVENFE